MNMKLLIFISVVGFYCTAGQSTETQRYRFCVAEPLLEDCIKMKNDLADKGGRIDCVSANDKIGCIDKVAKNEADFLPLEPEEIYVANLLEKSAFGVISEIRSTEFINRDYRYEPVAVIRNSAKIKSISDLKGKRSCHTGFGRNAGWKVPFSHLMDKKEISGYCDEIDAPVVERDMYAFSKYFGSACAPGKWVPEDDMDRALKQKYSELCKLCKSSDCSDKDGDGYIGYEGALMCLTQNDGDVAWTKMDAVEKHFKLKEGGIPLASQFSFLCWDGSSVPLKSKDPCSWAKRPWPAYLTSTRPSIKIPDLQEQLTLHSKTGIEQAASWRKSILEIAPANDLFHYPENYKRTYSPTNYLGHGNYTVTLQKPSCPSKNLRICVESGLAQEKCRGLRMASTGRRISPTFECVLNDNAATTTCLDLVNKGMADITFADAKEADKASKNSGMTSILSDLESLKFNGNQTGPYRYAVAVIRANSNITSLKDLQGRKSCHGSISSVAGWNIPLTVLRDNKLIDGPSCSLPIALGSFFNESCVPGAMDKELEMPWLPKSLCKLCSTGKSSDSDKTCVNNEAELYYGNQGALRCLLDNIADVAFIDHVTLNTKNLEQDTGMKPEEIRLLCLKGGVQEYTEFYHCNWGKVPTRKVLSRSGDSNSVTRADARLALLKVSDLFRPGAKAETILRLFAPYYGNSDLLFRDTSVGLVDEEKSGAVDRKLLQEFDYCTTSSANTFVPSIFNHTFLLIVLIALKQLRVY